METVSALGAISAGLTDTKDANFFSWVRESVSAQRLYSTVTDFAKLRG
jgi:hypothetical protein